MKWVTTNFAITDIVKVKRVFRLVVFVDDHLADVVILVKMLKKTFFFSFVTEAAGKLVSRSQCYKTFHIRNLQTFVAN
jgi:hypothetical protein